MEFRIPYSETEEMSEEELFWAVIEPIWPDEFVVDELEHLSKGTPGQRAIFSTTLFMREVDNGGIEQFFFNSSGIYSNEVLEGFKLLGMKEHYETVKKAFDFFPRGKVPADWRKRQKYLAKREKKLATFFEPLNDQIYGEERLYPYYRKYIDAHHNEFFIEINEES
jgi:hypothetical protein